MLLCSLPLLRIGLLAQSAIPVHAGALLPSDAAGQAERPSSNALLMPSTFLSTTQELQNSILDLSRRLQEAADERATMTAVARQREAEVARAQAEAAAAAEEAAEKARQLAAATTQLKVRHLLTCFPTWGSSAGMS